MRMQTTYRSSSDWFWGGFGLLGIVLLTSISVGIQLGRKDPEIPIAEVCAQMERFQTLESLQEWIGAQDRRSIPRIIACTYRRKP